MTEARRRTDPTEFLDAFALELRAAGVDVSRITTGVPILHPQIFSFSGLWQLGKGTSERRYRTDPGIAATCAATGLPTISWIRCRSPTAATRRSQSRPPVAADSRRTNSRCLRR